MMTRTQLMRAIVITRPGGPDVLAERDVARPDPGPHQLLVRIAATAVNRADLLQRMGRYPRPSGWPVDIPGLEYAGAVESAGESVTRWRPGDRVMGLAGGGSHAEYIAVHEDEAIRVPANLTLEQAAAIPEVFITAWDALIVQAALGAGDTLLVHAAGSGVGTAGIQIGRAVGARVIGSARTASKLERARPLGLDVAIDTSHEDFVGVVERVTDGRGADVILDLVGGDVLDHNVRSLATGGRLIIVGVVAGAMATLDMRALMRIRGRIHGTVLRSRSPQEKAVIAREFGNWALPLFETGVLRPVIDRVLPMSHVGEAHRLVESNATFGKIVLTV